MKKLIALVLALACVFALASCGKSNSGDYPATIMVNGTNYYSTDNAVPVEVDESVIQYTTSYAENGIKEITLTTSRRSRSGPRPPKPGARAT